MHESDNLFYSLYSVSIEIRMYKRLCLYTYHQHWYGIKNLFFFSFELLEIIKYHLWAALVCALVGNADQGSM